MAETTRREIMLGEGAGTGASQDLKLGMGPAHPAMHGIIRIVADLDGEIIRKADVEIGYSTARSRRTARWAAEQCHPVHGPLNYVSPLINNFAYASAVEKLSASSHRAVQVHPHHHVGDLERVCDT